MLSRAPAALLLLIVFTIAGPGALAQPASSGFVTRHEVTIDAPAGRVYEILVRDVGLWWDPTHTYSGDSANLSIDPRAGGCFCEKLARSGSVEHMRVVYAAPGEVLRMSGALGPLQASGVTGSLTWKLTGIDGATKVELAYSVGGFLEQGFQKIEEAVRGVLGDQLRRLESFVETGRPAPGVPPRH